VLTSEESLEQKNFQVMPEWCWDDTARQCIPDLGDSNWKGSATMGCS